MPSDRPQVKYRVDPEEKRAFEQYVDEIDETGQGRYGRHLERAMRQYRHEDRLSTIANRVDAIAETVGATEKKGKGTAVADGLMNVPEGKNPGDVSARQRAVITHLVDLAEDDRLPSDGYGHVVTQKVLKDQIEKVADVHSSKTLKQYVEQITAKGPFRRHPDRPGVWVVET